jgi:hypothetical protein
MKLPLPLSVIATLMIGSANQGQALASGERVKITAAAEVPVVAGAGINSCAEFAEFYRRKPETAETAYFGWAQGYMSATNGLTNVLRPTASI